MNSPASLAGLKEGGYYNGGQWKKSRWYWFTGDNASVSEKPSAKIKLGIMGAGVKFKHKFILKALLWRGLNSSFYF